MFATPVPKLKPLLPSVSLEASSAPVAAVPANFGSKIAALDCPSIIEPCSI
ncbi:hypothetical protein FLA105534_01516 [Flavobacterium bizetiae]|uniref:Uncharacterized protein n=1 Tax=Flavobacterium bizetiae TaxID=2704140 RepID=A0A6J4GI47_9FLAO|nr:hypothetical protein FLA105534_01516 [Flavobacterium bizetiae]CAD5342874.1 hypothetical protein FLA105535_02871 [Flavobacterium bizetiae]CAD5349299.1 hypothetical protein FLA105534_03283 [Flavobacterium bizetiae]